MKKLLFLSILLITTGCVERVATLDPSTGTFKTEESATVVTNKKVQLDELKSIILVSEDGRDFYDEFNKQAVKNIGYFNNVVDFDELQTYVIQNNLAEDVPELRDRLGLHNLAKSYKPFLWLRYKHRRAEDKKFYLQLILTNTLTFEDYFIAETAMDNVWSGTNSKENWYPMMNAFIDYIKDNSETFN